MAIGWIVLAILMLPCLIGAAIAGITALGASTRPTTTTTTTTRPTTTTLVATTIP